MFRFREVVRRILNGRCMTTSKRVQNRSRYKKIRHLEAATERWKILSKALHIMDLLKMESDQIIPVRSLEKHRRQINLPKPHKISDMIRKSHGLFELYKDPRGVLWCGLTRTAEELVEEEKKILEEHSEKAAENITRFLMMSIDGRLPVDKIAHFRRDFGLPRDFKTDWVHRFPQYFRVLKSEGEVDHLELVSWNPSWSVTELEKKAAVLSGGGGGGGGENGRPGMLSVPFPMKFPPGFNKVYRIGGTLENFQRTAYLSPYADARGINAGSAEFDKRAVAIMHELLSFTVEKRLVTDHLTHFRQELLMPQKLMRLLLKHIGIFYVSEKGKRFSVFLTEAYERSELIEKSPLVLWREKVQALVGVRGKKRVRSFGDLSEDRCDLFESDPEDETLRAELDRDAARELDDDGSVYAAAGDHDDGEMDVAAIQRSYGSQ